jgi:hypothetical protein
MKNTYLTALAAIACAASLTTQAQPLVNLGLVGVGRLSGDSFDKLGPGVDTLGGTFSGMWLDPATIVHSNGTIHATVFGLPDRGFGDGLQDYHPRVQRLAIAITPYFGPGPAAQDQIVIANTDTYVLTVNGSTFTGYQPDDTNVLTHPQSLATVIMTMGSVVIVKPGIGGGKWSLDPEGIAFAQGAAGGSWYISDEYGPFIYQFDNTGALLGLLPVPDAYIPRVGTNYPRTINYLTGGLVTVATDSGRYNNRGMEGLSITPDGKKLVACLQSPLTQDGENRNPSRNTRILVYDIDPASPTYNTPIAEYVHVLPLSAAEANNRHTPVSEILALSDKKYLILQRDSRGLGGDAGNFLYKRIVEVDASAASNILGTGYDLEKGAPGQISLPRAGLPSNVVAVTSRDLVDMLNASQLAKYGLNLAPSNQNINTLSEKWEGLGVIPLNDPAAPNDYLLLVGNDNDFRAPIVYHNGVAVGTNEIFSDNVLLAFRVGADAIAPTLTCPAEITVAASANCTLPSIASRVTATDNSAAPITITQSPAVGSPITLGVPLAVTVTARDAAGNNSTPCTIMVTVTDQTGPIITVPPTITATNDPGQCSAAVNYTATAVDNCGTVASFVCTPPSGAVFPRGTNTVTCTATDDKGNGSTATFRVVVRDTEAPVIVGVVPSRDELWPPNARLVPVTLAVDASDNCSSVTCEITGVTSSEPVTGPGDSTTPDWIITGPLSLDLRAERLTTGPGRIYTLTVRCTDSSGNAATKNVTVTVPHDQGKKSKGEL